MLLLGDGAAARFTSRACHRRDRIDKIVETFDDPNLKAALKRTLGVETAPAGLRQRVLAALDESETSSRRAWLTFRGQKGGLMAVAAALVLLVVGYAVFQGMNRRGGGDERDKQLAMKLFKPFAVAMAAGHETAIASPEFSAPSTADPTTLAQQLQGQVGIKPVVSMPADSGWNLHGAKVATLVNTPTAQAVFSKGNSRISVFSLPAKATYTVQDGAKYELMENRHPIAGFVRKGGMYCVVGDAGASLDDVKKLADKLEQATKGQS